MSSSIDNLGVGISYGIRGIKIHPLSNLVISIICFLFSVTGIYFGLWISHVLPGIFPVVIGAIILIIIGLRIILLANPRNDQKQKRKSSKRPSRLEKYMKNADFDHSKSIGFGEAIILGIALSANALTNGVGAGLLGFSPLLISLLAAVGSFVSVWIGVTIGNKAKNIRIGKFTVGQFGTLISGCLLVIIALSVFL